MWQCYQCGNHYTAFTSGDGKVVNGILRISDDENNIVSVWTFIKMQMADRMRKLFQDIPRKSLAQSNFTGQLAEGCRLQAKNRYRGLERAKYVPIMAFCGGEKTRAFQAKQVYQVSYWRYLEHMK